MAQEIKLTKRQLQWLKRNQLRRSYAEQAEKIGVSIDTLKRLLHKHGIRKFDGAKYARLPSEDAPRWTRPCIKCGSTEERERGLYMCGKCRARAGYSSD